MVDWSSSMQQIFEYYVVDPNTWKDIKILNNVKSCNINRDSGTETIGSATIDITESIGESYIRVYLITIQNGLKEKHPLGTFLVQTPSSTFDGMTRAVSMDAYSPLLELKEKKPAIGYSILKNANIMDLAHQLSRENARAPVVKNTSSEVLYNDFVANANDNWLSFLSDLVLNAKYKIDLDELGRIIFTPNQEMSALQPIWTYNDDNSSILYPQMTMDHDIYGIPNVVEVIYSKGKDYYYARVVNDDDSSPISTVTRGREIIYRTTEVSLPGNPTQNEVKKYAEKLLKELSSIQYTITYTHGYCPVRVGDCVRLNYSKAGLNDIKAKVISQSISCIPGCPVTEKAVFSTKLWR